MIVLSIFSLLYLRFLFALPRRIQALFVLAGGLYVIGGLGLEMLSWHYRFPLYDPENTEASRDLTYLMITHVEELLEMLGVAVFMYALLSYFGMNRITASMSISSVGQNT
jgi:predicted permease